MTVLTPQNKKGIESKTQLALGILDTTIDTAVTTATAAVDAVGVRVSTLEGKVPALADRVTVVENILNNLSIIGEFDASVETALPTTRPEGGPLENNDTFLITATGTINEVTYNEGDYLVYDLATTSFTIRAGQTPFVPDKKVRITTLGLPATSAKTYFFVNTSPDGTVILPPFTGAEFDGSYVTIQDLLGIETVARNVSSSVSGELIDGNATASIETGGSSTFTFIYAEAASSWTQNDF